MIYKYVYEVTEFGIIVHLQPQIKDELSFLIMALQFSLESYTSFPFSTLITHKLLHSANTPSSMLFIELGISMAVKPLQPENAQR